MQHIKRPPRGFALGKLCALAPAGRAVHKTHESADMSVINKMLKDLDDCGGLGPRSLEEGIRDVERVRAQPQPREERRWGVISAAVILVVLAIGVGWYLLQPAAPPPAIVKQAVPVAPKAPAPVAAPAAPVAAPPTPVAASAPAPQPPAPPVGDPPRPQPEVKTAPLTVATPPPAAPPRAEPAKAPGLPYVAEAQMAKSAADKSAAKTESAVAAALPPRAPATPPPPREAAPPPPVVATVQVPPPKAEPVRIE